MKRLIVYGDLHGCLDELKALRSKIGVGRGDVEYCVGDLINKGPKSLELLEYVRKMGIRSVRGNHEEKFVRYHFGDDSKWPVRLDEKELRLYRSMDKGTLAYLRSLPYVIQKGPITILHAGILPGCRLEELERWKDQMIRVRYVDDAGRFVPFRRADPARHFLWSELYDGRYGHIVYGHHPFLSPRVDRFSFGIDTGAVYGNALTAVVFERGRVERYRFVSLRTRKYVAKERWWDLGDL